MTISDAVVYAGVDDTSIDLFEGQYPVSQGVSYNSYVILDEKTAVMDTVDANYADKWLENIAHILDGREPDYLIVQHVEPDHSGSICKFIQRYPHAVLVGNQKTFPLIRQFFDLKFREEQMLVVKEGSFLPLGKHALQFLMAPLVHWPEVMITYEQSEQLLFSADAFGTFGALSTDPDWLPEARRYYINIVGKYGAQVLALLKKTVGLSIRMICPLHGPVLKENLSFYIDKYQTWGSYEPEEEGVTIAYASLHGNTRKAAKQFSDILRKKGEKNISLFDLNRDDMSAAVADAFRYDSLVLASVTYDASLFPAMEDFLYHLKIKNFQNRTVGYIQNGSWAPNAARFMKAHVSEMKNIIEVEPVVTIKSAATPANLDEMAKLADTVREKRTK